MAINFRRLITEYPDEETAINFFRQRGLLHNLRECKRCGTNMRQSYMTHHGKQLFCWRCTDKPCKVTLGLRTDTWFYPSELPFNKILEFIYWWCYEQTGIEFCVRELEINKNTVVDWNMYLREVKF